ncbi:hypothetical protein ABZ915_34660 [Streptomyces sp. NPDC046915]|uniref:hypothetical protein n=1 Tax=Streptomyces sp. NPDC046915 TaxID=3155257 RepID=UPI00340F09AE
MARLAVALALLLGWVIYQLALDYFTHAAAAQKPTKPVNINDVLKATVTILTLVGAVLAGVYAYRKQLLAEGDAHRADASQLAERYATAAGQLGHDQRLADGWQEQRQVCIDVLCAYLIMPYETDPTAATRRASARSVTPSSASSAGPGRLHVLVPIRLRLQRRHLRRRRPLAQPFSISGNDAVMSVPCLERSRTRRSAYTANWAR